ncbi:MAG: hypothetical protein VB144_01080 [Clostridia bacterium]|nr:hypothetical protein [Clostridia bacterium]
MKLAVRFEIESEVSVRALLSLLLAAILLMSTASSAPTRAFADAQPSPAKDSEASMVLEKMLSAQADLTSFEAPAMARITVNGKTVMSTRIHLIARRPNYVAVRWLGVTIRPHRGIIFVDPEKFTSGEYSLSVEAWPTDNNGHWIVSAASRDDALEPLHWRLTVDALTWLITRAEVTTSAGEHCAIEATYRRTGLRRWEPESIHADGAMLLTEFLPSFLVRLVAGNDAAVDSAVSASLQFASE